MSSAYQLQNRPTPILGLIKNVAPERLDPRAWLRLENMCVRNGQLQKGSGWTPRLTNTGAAVQVAGAASLITPVIFSGAGQSSMIATTEHIYQLDPTTNVLTALNLGGVQLESAPDQRWRADYLLGRWFFTNQCDGLWSWDGQHNPTQEDIQTEGANGSEVVQFALHLLVANLATPDGSGAQQFTGSSLPLSDGTVNWSQPTDSPDTHATNDDVDLVTVPDAGTAIVGMARLGNWLAIYKELSSVHLVSYVGGTDIYQIQTVDTMRGPVAGASVVDIGDAHVYVGRDNLYNFTGARPVGWGDRVWSWWKDEVDPGRWGNIFAFRDPRNREVYFCYTKSGAGTAYTTALVWNQEFDTFSVRDFPFRAIGLVRRPDTTIPTFDQLAGKKMGDITTGEPSDIGILQDPAVAQAYDPLVIGEDGTAYTLSDDAVTAGSAAANITATAESGDDCCGTERNMKVWGGMYLDVPVLTGTPLQVFVCARKSLGDPVLWKGPYLYRKGGRIDFIAQGRWARFKFVKPDGQWVLRGYTPLYQVRGER